MKQIIIDHFWRKMWIIVPLLFINIVYVRILVTTTHHLSPVVVWLLLFLGPYLLSYDQQRGLARALMALPVTAKQIGRAWWLSTVGVPALLLTVTTGLSAIVPFEGGQTGYLFLNCLMEILLLGSFVGLSPLMVASDRSGWHVRTQKGFIRAILGLAAFVGILALIYDFSWSNRFEAGIFVTAGIILTISGWFFAEREVWRSDAVLPGPRAMTSRPAQYKAPPGFGGLPFLWRRLFVPLGWLGLAFVGGVVLTGMFRGRSLQFPPQLVEVNVIPFGVISFFLVYMFVVIPLMTQLRVLRTLPISASILAATLVLIPGVSITVVAFACAALGEGHLVLGSLLTASAVAVYVPIVVWRGLGTATFSPAFLVVMVSAIMFPICFELADGPPIVTVLFSIIVIALSWEITRRVLRSSSQAYRVGPPVTSDWGGMRWS